MYVIPEEAVKSMLQAAEKKSTLSLWKMLIRSSLSGAILGYATSLSFVPRIQGLPPFVGAVIFPVNVSEDETRAILFALNHKRI